MKISTSESEKLYLLRNFVQSFFTSWRCIIETGGEVQVSCGLAFTNVRRQNKELDVRSGEASAVMQALHHSLVLKLELSRKVKFWVFMSVFEPILTYGNDS